MNSDLPHINESAIDELKEIMADDFALLITTFVADSETRLQEIAEKLEAKDANAFGRACHSLKGSATNVGVVRLAELCRQGEQMGNEVNMDAAPELLGKINEEFILVKNMLNAKL